MRLADRYALFFLPFTCAIAFIAWLISGDIIRSLAVFVAATPCPLILAAPVAFIAGIACSARRGILVKGGGPLEALARAHTVLFDKTGTLTVGGAHLLSIEPAPGEDPDDALKLGASLEQASHHVLASAIVQAAIERGLTLTMPHDVKEEMGAGLQGRIGTRRVSAGSCGHRLRRTTGPRVGASRGQEGRVALGAGRLCRGRGTPSARCCSPTRYGPIRRERFARSGTPASSAS